MCNQAHLVLSFLVLMLPVKTGSGQRGEISSGLHRHPITPSGSRKHCCTLNALCFHCTLLGHHVDMAKEHSALLLALEHRFYGDSVNPDGLKTENLANLSSKQAWVCASCVCMHACVCWPSLCLFYMHISPNFFISLSTFMSQDICHTSF